MYPESKKFVVDLPGDSATYAPSVSAVFGRINVLLGSNGTGKSRLLKRIRDSRDRFESRSPVYIEGGRVINIPNTISFDHQTFNDFGTLSRAKTTFRNRRLNPIVNRARDAFYLLERRGQQNKAEHSDAVVAWKAAGSAGPCPDLPEDPLDGLFRMFSEVFPEISIAVQNDDNKQIVCRKNGGNPYPVSELSDGERQVLFVLADIALSAEPLSLIVADEPELNLNPLLADKLWETIEHHLPEAVFVYGTHSIGFAMRPSVDTIIALKSNGRPAITIEGVHELDRTEARDFLGAIPAILSASSALVVEGDDASFDPPFYKWLLGRDDMAVVPIGGSYDVIAAARRAGMWSRLGADVSIVGVIDRDYKADASVSAVGNNWVILTYHEAESYLAEPAVACTLAQSLGIVAVPPTEMDIEKLIREFFESNLLRIAVTRTSARASVRLSVSVHSNVLRLAGGEAEIRRALEDAAGEEASKAIDFVGKDATVKIFDEELIRCRDALGAKDIRLILELAPGKELLARISPKVGCKDSMSLARAAFKHLDPSKWSALVSLRTRIHAAFLLAGNPQMRAGVET